MILFIVVFVIIALAAGFALGFAYANSEAVVAQIDEEREHKIQYLENLILTLDGPRDWEDRFQKEANANAYLSEAGRK